MIDSRAAAFFRKHHVLTVATCVNGEPWCASCFYVYMEERNALVFTTDPATRHGREFRESPLVAGSVVLETRVAGRIRGIQFQAVMSEPQGDELLLARKAYLKRFPVAILMETHLWIAELTLVKMTDNRLGFGKKLIWKKEGDSSRRDAG